MIEGVFDEKKKCEESLYFKLTNWDKNNVMIKIVNETGDEIKAPFICRINKTTGRIRRAQYVNDKLGFDLTWNDMVKVE